MTQFLRSDLRRLWLILGAVDALERPTLTTIVQALKMPKPTVNDALKKLMSDQVPDLKIVKNGPVYEIHEWGGFITKAGVRKFYNNTLKDV